MTTIVGRRGVPSSVRLAQIAVGITAAWTSVLTIGLLFVYPWQSAALLEPFAVFYWLLTYYLGRGQEWARILTWVIFGGALIATLLLLGASAGTVAFEVTLSSLIGTALNLTACVALMTVDSTDFFTSRGLVARTIEPPRNVWGPSTATQRVQAQTSGPGWYAMEQNPNIQTYWDGVAWVQRRQWTPTGYVVLPLYGTLEPTPAAVVTSAATKLISPRTVVTIIVVALLPALAALVTLGSVLP